MNRRAFLGATVATTAAAVAGCTALFPASLPDELEGVDGDADQLPTPTLGDGGVTVEVYEDLGCPGCQEFQRTVMPELEADLLETERATYHHYDFPLPADDRSIAAANAARAVQDDTRTDDEPNGAFFEYKRTVMETDDWSDDRLVDLAEDEGADPVVVGDALEEDAYYPTLVADWNRGDDRGVTQTPTVLVDGEEVDDPTAEEIGAAVDEAE
ncbi:DsbA family protein [Natrononativus amylolyticus]|uniref:DsbA family protein n=1 Tax=Natrononativus amylolyticus TaxID=2963434 RepID=UPI0020CCFA0C|nr:thioredoxin domain-containing protein [Natrononativus amylolyticus]